MNTNINAHNVCLLNADFSLLGMISVKKAIKLMCKKRVEVLKATDTILYNFFTKTVFKVYPNTI